MAITKIWVDDLDRPIIEIIEEEEVIVGYEQKEIEVVSETMKVDDLDKPIYQRGEDGQFVLDENKEKVIIGYGKKWATVHREPTIKDYEKKAQQELDIKNEKDLQDAHDYLNSTDWIVTKVSELGLDINTPEFKYKVEYAKRKEARAKINELET